MGEAQWELDEAAGTVTIRVGETVVVVPVKRDRLRSRWSVAVPHRSRYDVLEITVWPAR